MFSTNGHGKNDNEKLDASTIKELLETWEINDKARKTNEIKLINETINAMMLTQIQDIQDRQENAYNRFHRNLIAIRNNHQKGKNKWGE